MDDGKTPASHSTSSKPEPRPAPTDAELSRIAREAVHQAPDPRLDRHLQRMGLVDAPAVEDPDPRRPLRGEAAAPVELELMDRRIRRVELTVAILAVVLVVLAIAEVIALLR